MAKTIWDGFGRRTGSVATLPDGKLRVYDGNNQPLGSVGRDGTFTAHGKLRLIAEYGKTPQKVKPCPVAS